MILNNDINIIDNSPKNVISYDYLNFPSSVEYSINEDNKRINNVNYPYAYQRYLIKKPRTRKKGKNEANQRKTIIDNNYYLDIQQNINNNDYYTYANDPTNYPKKNEIIIENNYPYTSPSYYNSQEPIINKIPYTDYSTNFSGIEQPTIINSQPLSSSPYGIINYENSSPQIIQYPDSNIINNNYSPITNIQSTLPTSQNYLLNNQNDNLNVNSLNYQNNPTILTNHSRIINLQKQIEYAPNKTNVADYQINNLMSYNQFNNNVNIPIMNKENLNKNNSNELNENNKNNFFTIKKITKINTNNNDTNNLYNDVNSNNINNNIYNNINNNNITNDNKNVNSFGSNNVTTTKIDYNKYNVRNTNPIKIKILKNLYSQNTCTDDDFLPQVKVKRIYNAVLNTKNTGYYQRPSNLSSDAKYAYKNNDYINENNKENKFPLCVQKVEIIPYSNIRNNNIINKNNFIEKNVKKIVYPNLNQLNNKLETNAKLSEIKESDNELLNSNTLDNQKIDYNKNKNNEANKFLSNEKEQKEEEDHFNQLNHEEEFKKKMRLLLEQYKEV